jgi:hypothetical protein
MTGGILLYFNQTLNMKYIAKLCTVLFLCFATIASYAQETDKRPKLFASYPDLIDVPNTVLEKVMDFKAGQEVSVDFGSGFIFNGVVISNVVKYNNLQSVGIKSAALSNTILSISKVRKSNGSLLYVGRILNSNASDGYEIKSGKLNTYVLQKFETALILPVCNL